MNRLTDNIESIAERIRATFTAQDSAREEALHLCREVIRYSSNAIRSIHRQEFDQASEVLKLARNQLDTVEQRLDEQCRLISTGFIKDAAKEYAEGSITLALVTGKRLPSPEELRVEPNAYLNGMGEAIGELRRYLLDGMRRGDLSRGDEILSVMDDIYGVLVTMDFPDAITGGLRHTTDMVRGILERTRSDLTLTMRQFELEKKLTMSKSTKKEGLCR